MKTQSNSPIEIYLYSYIVDWSNQTARNFREFIVQSIYIFYETDLLWQISKICKYLAVLVQDIFGTKTVKKVLCFGFGDFCRSVSE